MRDRVEHPGGPGVQRRGRVAEPVQRGALALAEVPVAGPQPPDGRAGGCGIGIDADPGSGQVFGEGGQRGGQPFQGLAERVSQRGRGDRGSGLPAGRGHGGQRGLQDGLIARRPGRRQGAPPLRGLTAATRNYPEAARWLVS